MSKKLLFQFEHTWQAELLAHELKAAGIEALLSPQSKAYSELVTGNTFNATNIFVDESDFVQAQSILEKFKSVQSRLDSSPELIEKNYFKRVIVFSALGLVSLPIVFNWIAFQNFVLFKKQNPSWPRLAFAATVLVFGAIAAIAIVASLASSL